MNKNYDEKIVADFGHEWSVFDQSDVPEHELLDTFKKYFSIFPFTILPLIINLYYIIRNFYTIKYKV